MNQYSEKLKLKLTSEQKKTFFQLLNLEFTI